MPIRFPHPDPDVVFVEPLTRREENILRLMGRGWSNQRIAEQRFISVNTVKFHLKNIFRKLDVHGRTEAVWVAMQMGLFDDQERLPEPTRENPRQMALSGF